MSASKVVVIAGPTGVGKTDLSIRLAEAIGGEIVNYDSVQIYRGFDIGSAKPSRQERQRVPHHLFDVAEATDEINAATWAAMARGVIAGINTRGRHPILVGGTGFYLRALLAGLPEMPGRDEATRARLRRIFERRGGAERLHRLLSRVDPDSASRIAPGDRHRIERALEVWMLTRKPISSWSRPTGETPPAVPRLMFALTLPRPQLLERLDRRVEAMYSGGLVAETEALLSRYPSSARPFSSIGYAEAVRLLEGAITKAAAMELTRRRTRKYSKRQLTWLRSEREVQWVDATNRDEAFETILKAVTR